MVYDQVNVPCYCEVCCLVVQVHNMIDLGKLTDHNSKPERAKNQMLQSRKRGRSRSSVSVELISMLCLTCLPMSWSRCSLLVLAEGFRGVWRGSPWPWLRSLEKLNVNHSLVRSLTWWRPTWGTWSLSQKWSVALLVSRMVRPSTRLKSSLRWLDTTFLEFCISYNPLKHGRPGIVATHSSRFIPLKWGCYLDGFVWFKYVFHERLFILFPGIGATHSSRFIPLKWVCYLC